MKKIVTMLCVIIMMVTLVVGCTAKSPEEPIRASTSAAKAETSSGTQDMAGEAAVIRVGIPGPYSGSAATQGANLKYGAELAINEINSSGGINGMMIEPVYIDTENTAEVAVSAYQKLCTTEEVDIIVGEVSSSIALAVMDVIAKYQMPTIFAIPSSDEIGVKISENPDKYGSIFLTDPPSSKMQDGLLTFFMDATSNGTIPADSKSIAIISEDSDWGKSVSAAWREKLNANAWNIVVDEVMASGEVDFSTILTKIKKADPDVIKIEFTSVTSGAAVVKQLDEMDLRDYVVFGGYYMKNAEFPTLAGEYAQYHMNIMESVDPEFEKKLLSAYPEASAVASVWSYDSVYIMKEAVERAGSLESAALVNAIAQTDYEGALMRTVYDPETHFAMSGEEYKFYGAAQYIDNKFHTVYPYETAETKFVLVTNAD
jgi:branched-chain amino acid transport system substrate-binding protein